MAQRIRLCIPFFPLAVLGSNPKDHLPTLFMIYLVYMIDSTVCH